MSNLVCNPVKRVKAIFGLSLSGVLAFAFLVLAMVTVPKAHADTLPTACTSTNANCPLIYHGPPELNTSNDAANIEGVRFGSDVTVYCELVNSSGVLQSGSKTALTVLYENTGLLQVKAPSNATGRQLLAIYVERVTGGVTYDSTVIYVNSPTINTVSETTVRPGSTLYIWGRWLSQSNSSYADTSVIFRGPSGDISATITSGDLLQLQVTVPTTLVAGTSYSLVVANGWGGTLGETTYATPLVAYTNAADPFNLGVYWGADLAAVTTTYNITSDSRLPQRAVANSMSDQSAIFQADLNFVGQQTGGGILYVPAGTYVIDTELQIGYSKTVLKGAGTSTVLQYGATGSATTTAGFIAFTNSPNSISDSGISMMTVTNEFPTGSAANGAVRIFSGKSVSDIFLADVTFNLNQSYGMVLGNASHLVITRCIITDTRTITNPSGTADNGPISAGSPYFTFTNNTLKYEMGRVHFTNTNNQVVLGNTITIDGSVANLNNLANSNAPLETGGVELSFSDNVAYISNNISVSPAPDFATLPSGTSSFIVGCFELLLSQWSQYGMSAYGTVTAATSSGTTSSTITDSTKSWTVGSSLTPPIAGRTAFLAITDGPGIGQIRNITSYTSDTITVEPAFDTLPTASSSRYTVSYFVNNTMVAQDNTLSNGQVGVEVYSGGINTAIRRNKINGTHGIREMGDDILVCTGGNCANGYTYTRSLNWHSDINVNTVDNEDSPAVGNFPSSISVQTVQFEDQPGYNEGLHGNTIYDSEIRANTVKAHLPNVATDFWNNIDGWYVIGAWGSNSSDAGTASPYPAPLVSVLGVNMNGNDSDNAENSSGDPIASPLKVTANGVAGIQDSVNF
jgi:hypothetical protein